LPYIADASSLEAGSIVKIEKPFSSSGKPTYPHFFIVPAVAEPLEYGQSILLVGISSRIDPGEADPAKHVAMKWLNRRGGDPETGFVSPCYACMDFTHELEVYRGRVFELEVAADFRGRFIRAEKLRTVVSTLNAWVQRNRTRDGGGS